MWLAPLDKGVEEISAQTYRINFNWRKNADDLRFVGYRKSRCAGISSKFKVFKTSNITELVHGTQIPIPNIESCCGSCVIKVFVCLRIRDLDGLIGLFRHTVISASRGPPLRVGSRVGTGIKGLALTGIATRSYSRPGVGTLFWPISRPCWRDLERRHLVNKMKGLTLEYLINKTSYFRQHLLKSYSRLRLKLRKLRVLPIRLLILSSLRKT